MGTPEFAVAGLDALIEAGVNVAAVVTAPDRPAGRGRQLRESAVKQRAMELGSSVLQPERLRDPDFLEELDRLNADLFVVVAFRMLPEVVWSKPRKGTINLHASLLPQYRGAAPINWAVINGEERTGVSTFFIRHEIDTGDLLDHAAVDIGPEETAGELHDRLMMTGASVLVRTVRSILSGNARSTPQPSNTGELRHAPKLTPTNCRIDWNRSAQQVHDLIRGLSPFPGATSVLNTSLRGSMQFKILRSVVSSTSDPGRPIGASWIEGDRFFARCGSGVIELREVQQEGRKRMSAAEFTRGAQGFGSFHFS
ncbi:MAG: methionyl-tRNA formyltransferase [Flavobacteriales bacterium]|nr:methionyl-tRNA formyltransferase [Flavobacteriales bacterium]